MTSLPLYILYVVSLCSLAGLLIYRKAWREQLPFFCYVSFNAAWWLGMLLALPMPTNAWWKLYRIEAVIEQILAAWVCVSLLWEAFFPVIALTKRILTGWLFAIPLLAVLAITLPYVHPILTLDRVSTFTMTGCFAVVVLQFGDSRVYIKSHSYGVGVGFLLLLLAGSLRDILAHSVQYGDNAMMGVTIAVCGLWGVFFWLRDLPCRSIFGHSPDGGKARRNLESLGESDVHVLPLGNEVCAQWNSQGVDTTFFVRAEQIQLLSAIRAMEAVKLAEFERYEERKKHPQSEMLVKAKSAAA